jgi:hypothetical protein
MKIQDLPDVREYVEKYPVELHKNSKGRYTIMAQNEGGYNCVYVDLEDLIKSLKSVGLGHLFRLKN